MEPKTQVMIALFAFFGIVVPVFVRIAAGIVGAEEITPYRCIKAGLLGISGLAAAMKVYALFHSTPWAIVAMAVVWMAWIQFILKTSIPQTFGIWLMTHGAVYATGFALSHLMDVQPYVGQYLAQK